MLLDISFSVRYSLLLFIKHTSKLAFFFSPMIMGLQILLFVLQIYRLSSLIPVVLQILPCNNYSYIKEMVDILEESYYVTRKI